jgi:signal transduction histidine kinase
MPSPPAAAGRDMNVRVVRTMYRYLLHEASGVEADRFLQALGLDAAYLKNENNWIDYALYLRAWEVIRELTGDPAIGVKVGRFNISRQNLGSIWSLLRAAGMLGGGTAAGYRLVPRVANQLSRSGRFEVERRDRTGATLRWAQNEGYPFRPAQCEYRQGLLAAGPRLAGLPPAAVREAACIGRGDGACVYEVRFVADRAVVGTRWGAGIAAAGGLAMLAAGAGGLATALFAAAALACGVARDRSDQLTFNTTTLLQQMEELFEAKRRLQEDYDELRRVQQQLVESERLAGLGALSARVAHELRNPLGVIKGSAQVLSDDARPAEVRREMTAFIIEEVDRMNAAITNFLVFARPKIADRVPTDLARVVERLLLEWEARSEQSAAVRFSVPPGLPAVLVDPHQLHQVLLNLLLNASEAMQGAGTIEIAAAVEGERLRVAVTDDGPGFGADVRARAFEPFFTTKAYGTGLGLTNVKQMVEANGGTISVGNGPAGGARVTLALEIAR